MELYSKGANINNLFKFGSFYLSSRLAKQIFTEPVSADLSGCNFAFPGRHEYAPLAKFVARVIAPLVDFALRSAINVLCF